MATNENIVIQQRFVKAALTGDVATLQALCHPAFELHEGSGLPFAGIYKGAEGFIDFLRIFAEVLDVERLEPTRLYREADAGEYLACEFELRSVVRATGDRFDSSLVEIWRFHEGAVLEIRPHYFDAVRGSNEES